MTKMFFVQICLKINYSKAFWFDYKLNGDQEPRESDINTGGVKEMEIQLLQFEENANIF